MKWRRHAEGAWVVKSSKAMPAAMPAPLYSLTVYRFHAVSHA
jgi:hypothetical protein